jgi:hypothetical protein
MTTTPLTVDQEVIVALADQGALKRPDLAPRIERAVSIVLAGDVEPIAPGIYQVRSQSRPGRTYMVNGTCECPDARGKDPFTCAPQGLCKHRLAVRLLERAEAIAAERVAAIRRLDEQLAEAYDALEGSRRSLSEAMRQYNAARKIAREALAA